MMFQWKLNFNGYLSNSTTSIESQVNSDVSYFQPIIFRSHLTTAIGSLSLHHFSIGNHQSFSFFKVHAL
jgi:hypothetical protein